MFFSIIIPTCNRPELLKICLDKLSVASDKIENELCEIIITDDSINKFTQNLIKIYFPKFIWKAGPQRGPAANRNNGAKFAQGKWLIFLDDDCEATYNFLYCYWIAIQKYPDSSVFEGKIITSRKFAHSMETAPVNMHGGNLWSCNFCIKSNFYKMLHGFDETYLYPHLEDVDLLKRIQYYQFPTFITDAIVIHPPRIMSDGFKLGKYHQFDIYFSEKFKINYSLYSILKNIIFTRLNSIVNNPFSKYTFVSFYNMLIENIVVILNYNRWRRAFIGTNSKRK